jgi:integrase
MRERAGDRWEESGHVFTTRTGRPIAAGVAPRVVMEILGHSQIAVTMNVYAHVVQDTQRE